MGRRERRKGEGRDGACLLALEGGDEARGEVSGGFYRGGGGGGDGGGDFGEARRPGTARR